MESVSVSFVMVLQKRCRDNELIDKHPVCYHIDKVDYSRNVLLSHQSKSSYILFLHMVIETYSMYMCHIANKFNYYETGTYL